MSDKRIEQHHGRTIVCGYIFPLNEIKPGQEWQGSSGSVVTIESVDADGWVTYWWTERGERKSHTKEAFAFQCRYCLVLN